MLWSLLFILLIGQPTCSDGEPKCLEEFPFSKPESDWTTSQSLHTDGHEAEQAVDEKKGTYAKTENEKNSWWMIDLKHVYNISSVAIYNKDNKDISGAQIYIRNYPGNRGLNNTLVKTITNFKKGCWNVYQTNTSGRYITVFNPNKFLVLCEVRINGTKKEFPFSQTESDWTTSQSSVYRGKKAKKAVDGNKECCAKTQNEKNSWWMIDLKHVYNISSIAIYNNNYNKDISGAQIYIGNCPGNNGVNNTLVETIEGFQKGCWNVYQTNTSGRYITVFNSQQKHLVLCEVRINATKKDSPFELIKKKKTWENALEYCRAKGKDLATILNQEDQAWAELEAKKANTDLVWLGLHYTCVLEFWFWVADHPLDFEHWAPNNKTEECGISVAMNKTDHQWYSMSVYDKFNFLCEK